MALTATAQSALHERSWDEEIVPALRKRLEVESRTLANRMSVASLTTSTADDPKDGSTWPSNNSTASGKPSSSSNSHSSHRPMTAQPSSTSLRPSNIPRPSFQSSRPSFPRSDSSHTNSNGKRSVTPSGSAHTATPRKPAKRSRALSTPYPVDRTVSPTPAPIGQTQPHQSSGTILNGSSLPTPASSRSNSPYTQATGPSAKPSRIPRPGFSNSSSNLLNACSPDYAYQHQNQRALAPSPTPSTSTDINLPGSVNSRTHARILNEQAPFPASSSTSQVDVEEPESRASGEEERPYEHWYRGEVSRNGGVGELRIGKRKEMLDIANFGHSPRPVSAISMLAERGVRKRAESMSARESFYLDDERAVTERVLDEMPLTDPEDEDYISIAEGSTDRHQQLPTPTSREPPPLLAPPPANASKQSLQQPRRPTTSTTSKVAPSVRSATAPTPGPSSSTGAGPKKRVNNARGPATPGKKNVPRKPTRSMSSNTTSYPSDDLDGPDGAALADAIPSWSVPTAKNGNWDEVVLPVVARRMGLEGYEEVGGSSPKVEPPPAIPPAPGTFGYDHSKYRPPRSDGAEEIALDEFGRRAKDAVEQDSPSPPPRLSIATPTNKTPSPFPGYPRHDVSPPPSPAPFASYTAQPAAGQDMAGRRSRQHPLANDLPMYTTRVSVEKEMREEEDAGCCKCVVM